MSDLAHKGIRLDLESEGRMFWKLGPSHEVLPASLEEWRDLMVDHAARLVGYEEVATPHGEIIKVSTVFLGIDMSLGPPDRREVFESAVFGGRYGRKIVHRYGTWTESERGHTVIVNRLKNGLAPS